MSAWGRPWGYSNGIGRLYVADESRFGHGQRDKGIASGDLVLCVRHSGDHFFDYILIRREGGTLVGAPDIKIGSYSFREIAGNLDERDYHLLAAGQSIAADSMRPVERDPLFRVPTTYEELASMATPTTCRHILGDRQCDLEPLHNGDHRFAPRPARPVERPTEAELDRAVKTLRDHAARLADSEAAPFCLCGRTSHHMRGCPAGSMMVTDLKEKP